MTVDWAADVKKYAPDADEAAIAGIIRHCGIALRSRDASLVSFGDTAETDRVRESFLRKKLALTLPDAQLDQAIAAAGERMKDEHFRNRVTVYYLLAEHFDKLHLFHKNGAASEDEDTSSQAGLFGAAGAGAAVADAADAPHEPGHAAGAAGVIGGAVAGAAETVGAAASSVAGAAGAAAAGLTGAASAGVAGLTGAASEFHAPARGKWGWLLWLVLGLVLLALLLWLFGCLPKTGQNATDTTASSTVATAPAAEPGAAVAPAAAPAAAPAEGSVAIPTGAGVTTETRDGKPVVKVYFASGSSEVVPAFGPAADGLKAYLAAHAGTSLAVSGFADKSGNAALNAELSKKRAQAVKAGLVAGGIADASVALVKPADIIDASDAQAAARRVEVVVK